MIIMIPILLYILLTLLYLTLRILVPIGGGRIILLYPKLSQKKIPEATFDTN